MSPELLHFVTLTADQQAAAVRRLILRGFGDHSIAAATRLAVEQISLIRRATVGLQTPLVDLEGGPAVAAPFSETTE